MSNLSFNREIFEALWKQYVRNFSNNLKRTLESRKLSQKEFSKLVGVCQQSVANWLKGDVPNPLTLRRIAHECGFSMDDMMQSPGVELQGCNVRQTAEGVGIFKNGLLIASYSNWQSAIRRMKELAEVDRPHALSCEI